MTINRIIEGFDLALYFDVIQFLSPREFAMLIRTISGASIKEMAKEFGLSESRIRQIILKAIRRLKQKKEASLELNTDYLYSDIDRVVDAATNRLKDTLRQNIGRLRMWRRGIG